MTSRNKLSDVFIQSLQEMGFTHCYFVAGGNIMHLLNSVRQRLTCIPFAHEVGAAIATEYHNASLSNTHGKAFCLVTAGPGLTNAITAIAGAWQESRELLVVGGQVKINDLCSAGLRQRGIQEIDGVTLTSSITKSSLRIDKVDDLENCLEQIYLGSRPRKGPVFIEIPLDVQAALIPHKSPSIIEIQARISPLPTLSHKYLIDIHASIRSSERPVILLGGGLSRDCCARNRAHLEALEIPLMTTYNGADRISSRASNYFGRPNTWGMRYSNILIQQADLVLALGTRLGLQQTGFNWQAFAPLAKVIHVDIDPNELNKGHPRTTQSFCVDADDLLDRLPYEILSPPNSAQQRWIQFCQYVKARLPLSEPMNSRRDGYVNPYDFFIRLSQIMPPNAVLIPCSSGSSFTSSYQSVSLHDNIMMLSNKSQAAMGYGLSGAIGVALADTSRRVFLVEGDGGFLQNLQELAVARRHNLKLGIYLWINNGYASIRMTQKTYFDGAWLGCDEESGLGFPDWSRIFEGFNIPVYEMGPSSFADPCYQSFVKQNQLYAVLVRIDPFQTFYPKISSRITPSGGMESNPLHLIGPPLPKEEYESYTPYLSDSSLK